LNSGCCSWQQMKQMKQERDGEWHATKFPKGKLELKTLWEHGHDVLCCRYIFSHFTDWLIGLPCHLIDLTLWPLCACTDLCDDLGVLRPVVVDEDAGSAGYENHEQRHDDVDVGHCVLHVRETLTVEVEQQGHHAQSQQRGAGSHHNTEGRTGMRWKERCAPVLCKLRLEAGRHPLLDQDRFFPNRNLHNLNYNSVTGNGKVI